MIKLPDGSRITYDGLVARYDALAAELAEWKGMRNEMRDVAFANKERAETAEASLAQAEARVAELAALKPQTLRQRVKELEAQLKSRCDESDERGLELYQCWQLMKEALPLLAGFAGTADIARRFKLAIRDLPARTEAKASQDSGHG